MRAPSHAYRGFTLVELIAVIVIIAILAAVSAPSLTAANPFAERGYVDSVAADLRRARAVAFTTGCDVQFTIDGNGYRAQQRAAAGTHCASAGAWVTPVFSTAQPASVVLAANRQLVFAADGTLATAPVTIDIGTRSIAVSSSGLVQP
jgi:type II secretion system protein H